MAPYPDSAHSFKDKCLLLLGERDFRNFSSAKVNTVKSWLSDLLRPELNHGAPTAPAEGLILMNVGYEGLVWQVDEYSRARATALSAMVQERMAGANVAREMERAMRP